MRVFATIEQQDNHDDQQRYSSALNASSKAGVSGQASALFCPKPSLKPPYGERPPCRGATRPGQYNCTLRWRFCREEAKCTDATIQDISSIPLAHCTIDLRLHLDAGKQRYIFLRSGRTEKSHLTYISMSHFSVLKLHDWTTSSSSTRAPV